jgi:hypothetical protein
MLSRKVLLFFSGTQLNEGIKRRGLLYRFQLVFIAE